MKNLFFAACLLFSVNTFASDTDFLSEQVINYNSPTPDQVLEKTVANLKSIFDKFQVQVDASSKITSPKVVGGTATNPTLQVGLKKCVLFLCKDVVLNAIATIQEVSGSCARTFMLTVDMSQSTGVLHDNYDRLDAGICYNASNQTAQITVDVSAHHAPGYQAGEVQTQVFGLLQIQIPAIASAISKTLIENGASQ